MGERLLCKQEVIGSIPFTSTTGEPSVSPRDRRSAAAPRGTHRQGQALPVGRCSRLHRGVPKARACATFRRSSSDTAAGDRGGALIEG